MRYLVLVPQPRALEYSVLDAGLEEPVDAGKLDPFDPSEVKPSDLASRLHTALFANKMAQLDMVAIRCPFGGSLFEALDGDEGAVMVVPLHTFMPNGLSEYDPLISDHPPVVLKMGL